MHVSYRRVDQKMFRPQISHEINSNKSKIKILRKYAYALPNSFDEHVYFFNSAYTLYSKFYIFSFQQQVPFCKFHISLFFRMNSAVSFTRVYLQNLGSHDANTP